MTPLRPFFFLRKFDELCLPLPVIGELLFGAMNSARPAENVDKITKLLTRCRPLGADVKTAEVYARLRLDLKRAGTPIPENDVWIAAVCVQHSSISLATEDHHFTYIARLNTAK